MPTPSWTVSFITPTASNSPAKACAGHEANRTRRLDQPPSPVTQIHRPARLATRAASFRYGGRHHSGIPGDIIPLYPGDFVGIRRRVALPFQSKIDKDAARPRADAKLADTVASAVTRRPRYVQRHDIRHHEPCDGGSAVFEGVRAFPEMVPDNLDHGLAVLFRGQLFDLAPILQRARRHERSTTSCPYPCLPSIRSKRV